MPGYFDYIWHVKVKIFSHSRIFKDRNTNSSTFQGLEFSFANSRTFQDLQGPWQPCVLVAEEPCHITHKESQLAQPPPSYRTG